MSVGAKKLEMSYVYYRNILTEKYSSTKRGMEDKYFWSATTVGYTSEKHGII